MKAYPARKAVLAAFLALLVPIATSQSVLAPHGAYLGCFELSKLERLMSPGAPLRLAATNLKDCSGFCRSKGHALNAITPAFECHCTSVVPADAARAADTACAKGGGGAAVFYNHRNVNTTGCRLANVPMEKSRFSFHYNDYHASFDNGVMTLKMDGSNGLRFTTNDGMHQYGLFQVAGKTTTASGAVTAFYTRSSDDYNTQNWGTFDEIDFEFLNGNPSVPAGLWLNSFRKGISGGERLVKPPEYQQRLRLTGGADAGTTFLTYTINWQPDQVLWYADGQQLLRRYYGENVTWADMRGQSFTRSYRPPADAQHVTFSMWADQDQNRAFGGPLDWSKSPFTSQFKELRRVLCDAPAATARGPEWLYPAVKAPRKDAKKEAKKDAKEGAKKDAKRTQHDARKAHQASTPRALRRRLL